MLVHHLLERSAECHPDRPALIAGDRRLSYRALNAEADQIAGALHAAGVRRGDRVVLYLENVAESVIGLFAALKAGATFSVINPTTKREKLTQILANCRPAAMIVDRGRAAIAHEIDTEIPSLRYLLVVGDAVPAGFASRCRVESWSTALAHAHAAPEQRTIDLDLATIIYTSGSTGTPKGVMSTHRNVLAATTSINACLRNTHEDVIIVVLPLSFDYGLYQIFLAFQAGAAVVLEKGFAYPAAILQRMRAEGVTGFPCVPTMFSILLQRQEPCDLPSLRYLTNTAAALPVEYIERIRRAFPGAQLFSMYGLTECKRVSILPPEELERRPDSVGLPIPNTETYIVDEDGNRLPPRQVGELVVRGSHVMRGYWQDPVETAKRYRPGPFPGESVLYTGDSAWMDEDGFLYFAGRRDDIIKSRGEKVSPLEVERVAYKLDGVVHAAVIGVPDEVLGEAITLVVSTNGAVELTEREIRRHCQQHLEDFMVPKHIEIWPDLPKSPAGKIDKLAVRALKTAAEPAVLAR